MLVCLSLGQHGRRVLVALFSFFPDRSLLLAFVSLFFPAGTAAGAACSSWLGPVTGFSEAPLCQLLADVPAGVVCVIVGCALCLPLPGGVSGVCVGACVLPPPRLSRLGFVVRVFELGFGLVFPSVGRGRLCGLWVWTFTAPRFL